MVTDPIDPLWLHKLQLLHQFLKEEQTGGIKELAGKVGLPVNRVYNWFAFSKYLGGSIKWDRVRGSYYYDMKDPTT